MAAYCNRTCGVHGHYVDQIKIVIENYLFSQPLCLSFIPQATASTRVQLREKVKLFRASQKLRGNPRPIFKPKLRGLSTMRCKKKDVVWRYKEVIKPQSCQSFCVFRWVPAAYSTFVSLSLFFFWKRLIFDLKRVCSKTFLFSSCEYLKHKISQFKIIGVDCNAMLLSWPFLTFTFSFVWSFVQAWSDDGT